MIDNRNQMKDNKLNQVTGSIRQVGIRKVDTMEENKTIDINSAKVNKAKLDQISGGVNNITENELYENSSGIDLLNPDFLSEKI